MPSAHVFSPPAWAPLLQVVENEREAEQLQRLKLQIGGAASAYTKAGQFIQVGAAGGVGWRMG